MVEPYNWVVTGLTTRSDAEARLDFIQEVREGIEARPETSATFRLSEVTERGMYKNHITNVIEYFGAWHTELYSTSDNRYVNPSYRHRPMYTDSYVECRCGTPMTHKFQSPGNTRYDWEHNHTDDCPATGDKAAQEELDRALDTVRRNVFKRCSELAWNGEDVAYRLGFSDGHHSQVRMDLGIPWEKWKMYGRRCERATWKELHERYNVPYSHISEAFDVPPTTIYSRINQDGDYDFEFDRQLAGVAAGGD